MDDGSKCYTDEEYEIAIKYLTFVEENGSGIKWATNFPKFMGGFDGKLKREMFECVLRARDKSIKRGQYEDNITRIRHMQQDARGFRNSL